MVPHVLGLSFLDKELHPHPITHTWLVNIYLPLVNTEDSSASAGQENNISHQSQEQHTLHWEKGLWTSIAQENFAGGQTPRVHIFSSVANTWLNRDGLEQLHFHWVSVHLDFSIHFENERFLE